MRILRRARYLVALFLLAVSAAHASNITKLGVMSVLGRDVQAIIHAPTTGTRVDRNARESLDVGDTFETFILRATADSARREGLGEALILARPANGSRPWQRDGQAVLVTRPLLEAAQAAKLSHLLLIQPAQGPANLQLYRGQTGAGQLEGLGFYVDTALEVERVDKNQHTTGFLAPYAYFDIYLVEVATLDLQAEYRARASVAVAGTEQQGNDPWRALSTQQKVEILQHLLQQEIDKALHEWTQPRASSAG